MLVLPPPSPPPPLLLLLPQTEASPSALQQKAEDSLFNAVDKLMCPPSWICSFFSSGRSSSDGRFQEWHLPSPTLWSPPADNAVMTTCLCKPQSSSLVTSPFMTPITFDFVICLSHILFFSFSSVQMESTFEANAASHITSPPLPGIVKKDEQEKTFS